MIVTARICAQHKCLKTLMQMPRYRVRYARKAAVCRAARRLSDGQRMHGNVPAAGFIRRYAA